jgi:hypothetical protein
MPIRTPIRTPPPQLRVVEDQTVAMVETPERLATVAMVGTVAMMEALTRQVHLFSSFLDS